MLEKLAKPVRCEDCPIAKATKLPMIAPSMMSYDKPLSLAMADLSGPFPVKALGGFEFALETCDVLSTITKLIFQGTNTRHWD